jgi:hypothetical protein
MALTTDQIRGLLNLAMREAVPLPFAAKALNLDRRTLYDWTKTAIGRAHIMHKREPDGLLWIRTRPEGLYLLSPGAKVKLPQKTTAAAQQNPDLTRFNIGHRVALERKAAVQLVQRQISIYPVADDCKDLFDTYLDRVDKLGIELMPNPNKDFYGPPILVKYSNRFNDAKKKSDIRKRYFSAWDGAAEKYKTGVFMTLTTDPKQFDNLWEANKQFQANWNKLITYLRKKTGRDLEYICVREFQKNGRLHFHAAIFGIKYLINTTQLSNIWNKYGQGKIVHIYSMHTDPTDNEFVWARAAPDDSQGRKPKDYVKKYILKAQYETKITYQYWIYNTRFFTYSGSLLTKLSYYISKGLYSFVRSVDLESESCLLYYSGDLLHVIEPEPLDDPPPSPPGDREGPADLMTTNKFIEAMKNAFN